MKICWDTLEQIQYNPKYGFRKVNSKNRMYYVESKSPCLNCGDSFLTLKNQNFKYCSRKCGQSGKHNNFHGKKRPNHSKRMVENNPMEGVYKFGSENPNWKGGISINKYCEGWNYLSKEIRDYYKICQNPNCCGKSNRMTSHHVDYNKQNCHPDNLICLCHICNAKANARREYHTQFYKGVKRKCKEL